MKKTWPATFVDMWTARFRSFTHARDDNAQEFKRFSVEKMWMKPFSLAFVQENNVFVEISKQIMPLLWHVWYKDTVQVSDGFGSKRGVLIYHIKLQRKSNFGACLLGLRGRGDCLIMLEYRIIKTTEYSIRISILDTHPYFTCRKCSDHEPLKTDHSGA